MTAQHGPRQWLIVACHGTKLRRPGGGHNELPATVPEAGQLVLSGPADVGTSGGLIADEYAPAVDGAGGMIKSLYAAGNITASAMGASYPGARAGIRASMVFAYIAAARAISAPASYG